MKRYGDPLGSFDYHAPAVAYFWSKVEKTDGCWLWRGRIDAKGYGQSPNAKLGSKAHRIAYTLVKGPIGADPETGKTLDIDHLCRNRACVNPDHLEPVTHMENIRRGNRYGGYITCKRGHNRATYSKRNINGHVFCAECARENDRARRPRRYKT